MDPSFVGIGRRYDVLLLLDSLLWALVDLDIDIVINLLLFGLLGFWLACSHSVFGCLDDDAGLDELFLARVEVCLLSTDV